MVLAGAAGAGQPEHGREERGGGDHTRAALRQASQSGQNWDHHGGTKRRMSLKAKIEKQRGGITLPTASSQQK